MKIVSRFFCAGIIFLFLFSSCTIEKRKYLSGYNIQWENSKPGSKRNESVRKNKPEGTDRTIAANPLTVQRTGDGETITASADASQLPARVPSVQDQTIMLMFCRKKAT